MLLNQAYQLFRMDRESYCSRRTLEYYDENVNRFMVYLAEENKSEAALLSCDVVDREAVLRYMAHLRALGIKNTSINTYFRAVKTFVNYCIEEEFVEPDTLRRIRMLKSDQEVIEPLTALEVNEIDGLFNPATEGGLRNLCIVHLMLDAGFRCSDVVNLKYSYINFDKNYIMAYGKGNKYRTVVLAPRLKKMLFRYLIMFRAYDPKDDYFVFTEIGSCDPITVNVIKQLFARIKKRSKIDRVHPHLLRHTFATSYILGGGNMEFLRLMLGHVDYGTTKLYLHLAQQSKMLHTDIYQLDPVFFRSIY